MPTLTITKQYDDTTVLTEAQLDAVKDSIETFVNTTKLDSNNIQTGGIATANYAAGSVDASALGSSAVTTAKINDSAVTTAKIADLNVTTAKIAANAVTRAKLESLGQQVSSSSGTFSTSSTSHTDVTNLSVSITTTGRPVFIGLIPDGSTSNIGSVGSNALAVSTFAILRDSTVIALSKCNNSTHVPPGSIFTIEAPAAGTYTYKLQAAASTGSTQVQYCKLIAYEL